MIALALVAALQAAPLSVGDAVARHDECVEHAARKFLDSREPADVVAGVAMWECQGRYSDIFEASVDYTMANVPGSEEMAVRRRLLLEEPQHRLQRLQLATYFVVSTRMGMSWNMPHEPYNARWEH